MKTDALLTPSDMYSCRQLFLPGHNNSAWDEPSATYDNHREDKSFSNPLYTRDVQDPTRDPAALDDDAEKAAGESGCECSRL